MVDPDGLMIALLISGFALMNLFFHVAGYNLSMFIKTIRKILMSKSK